MDEIKRKKRKGINKTTKRVGIVIFLLIIGFLFGIYYKPVIGLNKSKKDLAEKMEQLETEQRTAQEIKAKLAYLNTEDGIKHIAKLNGFVEPGEVVIQLSENPDAMVIEKPKKNIFGKRKKLACIEHTKNGKQHYQEECVVCQKINKIYEESLLKQEQEELQIKAAEKEAKELEKIKKEETEKAIRDNNGKIAVPSKALN